MRILFALALASLATLVAAPAGAQVSDFENLPLQPQSYWNGYDNTGGFASGAAYFPNNYSGFWYDGLYYENWDGWACSNMTDATTAGYSNQYSAYAGGGAELSSNYGVSFLGSDYVTYELIPTEVNLLTAEPAVVAGACFTNTTYAALAMRDGTGFNKAFGGENGTDPDYFKLIITGLDAAGAATGAVEFMLADYTAADSADDYIVQDWTWVDLTSLGAVAGLQFMLESTDTGAFGMNNPAYFAMDNLVVVPEPLGLALLALGGLALRRR